MNKNAIRTIRLTTLVYICIVAGILILVNACSKGRKATDLQPADDAARSTRIASAVQGQSVTEVLTVADIRPSGDGSSTKVMFNENEEVFNASNAADITTLKNALNNNEPVQVVLDPWRANVNSVSKAPDQNNNQHGVVYSPNTARKIDLATMNANIIDNPVQAYGIAPINTTTSGLTNVIPDMATAQTMFQYIAHQCCALPGPYNIDHCISFQYCEDGCYARAHKMCWIINNMYHYGTQKVFSFANAGTDELCVQAQKWGGCCVNWWYHVAPLVTIQTTTGPKAYVFDPAMFDQPVLLSAWLHAQENPNCVPSGDVPHVTMINVQPTSSYSPSNHTGYAFDTDPYYTNTNSTLNSYKHLTTCP